MTPKDVRKQIRKIWYLAEDEQYEQALRVRINMYTDVLKHIAAGRGSNARLCQEALQEEPTE